MTASDAILETKNLTKQFGALTANDAVSLTVDRGTVHGVIGPNGSGKTTFFNTLSGLCKPDGGTIRFNGNEITDWEPHRIARRGLGRTFQIVSPFENMTVRQNLLATQSDHDDKQARADEILAFLEIDHIADNEASNMSGGQKKLLELGRVLMLDPQCILLDEPTAGVNPALQQRILDHLQELNDEGTTFLVVEHDMSVIEEIVDTVSVFDQGQHIVQGSFAEVTDDKRVREAYLGSSDGEVPI